jgi:hypothetical protein
VKKKMTILATVLGLLALSGLAIAAEHDGDEPEDTVFNYGYDEENQVLVWGLSPVENLVDCTLEGDPIVTTYGPTDDGVIEVPLVEFDLCGLSGVAVAGPNGQVNHGMFMKSINSVFEGTNRGCINRFLARSPLGKGEQQIQVSDDPETTDVMEGDLGSVDFTTVLADCERGKKGNLTGQDRAAANKAAAAEKERGNSTSAPGRSGSSPGNSGPAQSNSDSSPGKSGSAPGHNK